MGDYADEEVAAGMDRPREELTRCDGTCVNGTCRAESPDGSYFCTRPKGHAGNHIACGKNGKEAMHNLAVWPRKKV